jgi:hypothetical protein
MASPKLFKSVIYNIRKLFRGKTHVLDIDGKASYKSLNPEFVRKVLGESFSLYNLPEKAVRALKVLRAYGRIRGKH